MTTNEMTFEKAIAFASLALSEELNAEVARAWLDLASLMLRAEGR